MAKDQSRTPAIELINVTRRFVSPTGKTLTALKDFNMAVERGEFVAVVGPTGCGKSTTLNLVTGLAKPSAGEVRLMGGPVNGIDPRVGLGKFLHHYPHQLSGGMRKRVALAQTFINEPEILLMDEPFSALDVQTRTVMHEELLKLWAERKASVIFVTHDLEEAVALADKVYVLTAGPATVKSVYPIALPRPRVVSEIRYEPEFVEYCKTIWEDMRQEVETSYRRASEAA
ncbi:ABC transporter ATP-binding protein [Agrobacterium vitis]|uniref:ABC transporter ATP-binding protein n=1 Tax=Allorhizobium ampelinum TaxID=3025782 RepID=UPI001F3CB5CA|nr:ABC transporter ATP-binding protein [Allorhizobium ampelinum]MCF1450113.1 ABC transporter ATP-binding protein [Allorhizobium ampelinum]